MYSIRWSILHRTALQLLCVLLTGVASNIHADVVVYFGGPDNSKLDLGTASSSVTPVRNSFLDALASFEINDLESISQGANPTIAFPTVPATAQSNFSNGVNSFALYATSGNNFLYDTDGSDDGFDFSAPITAFGTYLIQAGDSSRNRFSVRLQNSLLGTSKLVDVGDFGPSFPFFNVMFLGVTDSTGFDSIDFIESFDSDGVLYDDLIVGNLTAVPEPSTIILLVAFFAIYYYIRTHRTNSLPCVGP